MKYENDVKNRLKRIEGQARGVLRMMDEEKDCREVITQLSAVRAAVDRAILYIVGTNMEQCLRENIANGEETDDVIKEAVQMLVKSR
ncbi:metal-sensitive transcriptional regulator [Numidum massiliense]|uniref:metal-sensitive transcriptional regulator n=1 Tax=Numidum massiliense TaxID=1522315 RepID=UPI0006D5A3C4|nr:metal-sensitive transcriptional regulator [Numidum massiliense]